MAANLSLVAHAAQRHTHEVAVRRLGDRLAERCLTDARRSDQAQNRSFYFADTLLHGEILEDAFLHLLEAEVIGLENLFGVTNVVLGLGALLPRNRQHPVEVVAHDRCFGGHWAHGAEFLDLRHGLLARFLGQLRLLDALFELGGFVLAVLALAEFLLNRLHLLVQIVLALRLLHLPLDAVADALLHLEHVDFRLHVGVDFFQPLGDRFGLKQRLLVRDLELQVRGNRIGELARVLDLVERHQDLGRNFLVELDVLLELAHHRARERFGFARLDDALVHRFRGGLEIVFVVGETGDAGALNAFHQHLHGAIGKLQKLQNSADGADRMDIAGLRIVLGRVLLRDQQDLLAATHHFFQRPNGLLASHEQRNNHVRKHNDVTKRQNGVNVAAFRSFGGHRSRGFFGHTGLSPKPRRSPGVIRDLIPSDKQMACHRDPFKRHAIVEPALPEASDHALLGAASSRRSE